MSGWYGRVTADPNDFSPLVACFDFYEKELEEARKELDASGKIELTLKKIPGLMEYRFNQLQEIEAILRYLELHHAKVKGIAFKGYMESYARALSSRDAEKYADCDDKVLEAALLLNQVLLLRNQFLGITKGLEYLHYQLTNVVKLRVAGIEDAQL